MFLMFWVFIWYHFPWAWRICFSKSYNAGIVGDRVSKFSSDIFICSLFLKDISGDIEKYYNLLWSSWRMFLLDIEFHMEFLSLPDVSLPSCDLQSFSLGNQILGAVCSGCSPYAPFWPLSRFCLYLWFSALNLTWDAYTKFSLNLSCLGFRKLLEFLNLYFILFGNLIPIFSHFFLRMFILPYSITSSSSLIICS